MERNVFSHFFFLFFFKGHTENTDYNDENDDERRPEWMDQYVNIFIFPNGVFFCSNFCQIQRARR